MVKKTLLISYNYPPVVGGIETYSFDLINYFKDKNNISFIIPKKKKPVNRNLRAISMIVFSIATIAKIIFKKYDLIHITNFNLWIVCYFYSLFYKKTKFVISLWGLELVFKNKKGLLPVIHKLIVPIAFISKQKNFNFLTSSNSSIDLALNCGIKKQKLFKVPLGVSQESVHQINSDINFEKYFLFSGRITQRKGLSWFAENILPNFPEYKLLITGSIVEKDELLKTLRVKNTEWLGRVSRSELVKLRQKSCAIVIPNILQPNQNDFEAYGYVTIESVANGGLVIASDYQGLSDSLQKGALGFLAKASDINSWVRTLNKVININKKDKIKIISQRSLYVKNNLTLNTVFKETEEFYKSL